MDIEIIYNIEYRRYPDMPFGGRNYGGQSGSFSTLETAQTACDEYNASIGGVVLARPVFEITSEMFPVDGLDQDRISFLVAQLNEAVRA